MFAKPYTAREICQALGISLDTLYRTRERWHAQEKLPRPICEHPLKWERTGFDVWLTRHHPLRPPAPANDVAVVPDDGSIAEARARLAAAYSPHGGATYGRPKEDQRGTKGYARNGRPVNSRASSP